MNPIFSFAYGRVSSSAKNGVSRQEHSIEIQDSVFRDYIQHAQIPAESFGLDFERIYLERHTGAFDFSDIRKRPEGLKLWNALTAVRTSYPKAEIHLLLTKLDRVGRGWLDTQIMLRDLRTMRVRLHIINLGGKSFDCESLMGQKILADLAWLSEMEVMGIRERITDAMRNKRRNGELLGSCPPFGWNAVETGEVTAKGVKVRRLEDNCEEQKWILHMAYRRYECGWSYPQIAKELNERGVPTKRGKGEVMRLRVGKSGRSETRFTSGKWQCGNVAKVLSNATVRAWLEQQTFKKAA
ncbi:MAG TPA: recombinase family protein [Verrucomicrobiae bacterium]|nr:recombinase family protein [Verrucomicrobiae bacterium]